MDGQVEATDDAAPLEDSSVTMLDVLEEEIEMENEYAAVLGASDEKCCTYAKGPIKRQALYSCLTCCPEARGDLEKCAGVCLACCYRCHENHELVELYTKRNFRCDCPTERMGGNNRCVLNASVDKPQPYNKKNLYNQNFQGLYCTCRRPYPDPERTSEELMLQCVVCEDWFHLQHLDVPAAAEKLVDTCSEMICGTCMEQHAFLRDYTGLALKALEEADESDANITVTGDVSVCEESDNKLHSDLDKSIADIMNMSGVDAKEQQVQQQQPQADDAAVSEEPENKRQKLADTKPVEIKCTRPTNKVDYVKGGTFWGNDWRTALCQCACCLDMYKQQGVEFLLDMEDSAKSYEDRGKKCSESSYEQGIRALASIDRVHQIDAITEYNRMKDKLKKYLHTFAVSKKIVTEEDINRFFEEMRNEKNTAVQQPHFCR